VTLPPEGRLTIIGLSTHAPTTQNVGTLQIHICILTNTSATLVSLTLFI